MLVWTQAGPEYLSYAVELEIPTANNFLFLYISICVLLMASLMWLMRLFLLQNLSKTHQPHLKLFMYIYIYIRSLNTSGPMLVQCVYRVAIEAVNILPKWVAWRRG